jgi:hypothetical protein
MFRCLGWSAKQEKGKPEETQGRKATGLFRSTFVETPQIAGPPKTNGFCCLQVLGTAAI